jgi:hypothetical protein
MKLICTTRQTLPLLYSFLGKRLNLNQHHKDYTDSIGMNQLFSSAVFHIKKSVRNAFFLKLAAQFFENCW